LTAGFDAVVLVELKHVIAECRDYYPAFDRSRSVDLDIAGLFGKLSGGSALS